MKNFWQCKELDGNPDKETLRAILKAKIAEFYKNRSIERTDYR